MFDRFAGGSVPDLTALRMALFANPGLMAELAAITNDDEFVDGVVRRAADLGVTLDDQLLLGALRPDPLGLSRFAARPLELHWPPAGFLPASATASSAGPVIDWTWFGPEPLVEPFFEGAIRGARRHPFNRIFHWRMSLGDFVAGAGDAADSLAPDGFIFHMSRCGSTLVSQMLARCASNSVISEAAPIDFAVQTGDPQILRAMVQAFGRRRSGRERRLFVKLDSWHALALPLFERAFPRTPWIFLFRDPVEVMVSQRREPGAQMVPHLVAPSIYGLDPMTPGPDYTARVLSRICMAAADALASPRGLAVNYRELPSALEGRILPHFGLVPDAADLDAMRSALGVDAKSPALPFFPDSATKQAAASAHLRELTEQHLTAVIGRLDAIAATQSERRSPTLL